MLGRLARWLRASGLDVLYDNSATDDQLIRIFLSEKRWILTRDRGLIRRRVLQRGVFIESQFLEEQLEEFFIKTDLFLNRSTLLPFSRCLECNEKLRAVE